MRTVVAAKNGQRMQVVLFWARNEIENELVPVNRAEFRRERLVSAWSSQTPRPGIPSCEPYKWIIKFQLIKLNFLSNELVRFIDEFDSPDAGSLRVVDGFILSRISGNEQG